MEPSYHPEKIEDSQLPTINLREVGVAAFAFISGVISWILYWNILSTVQFNSTSLTLVISTLVIFNVYVAAVLVALIFSQKNTAWLLIGLLAVTPVVLFVGIVEWWLVLIVALVLGLTFGYARIHVKRSYNNQIKFFLPGVIRVSTSTILFVLVLITSGLHFSVIRESDTAAESIERSVAKYTVIGLNLFLNQFDWYSSTMSVDSFIYNVGTEGFLDSDGSHAVDIPDELEGAIDVDTISNLILAGQSELVRTEFFRSFGLSDEGFNGMTPIQDIWTRFAELRIRASIAAYEQFLPVVISIGVFVTLLFLARLFKIVVYLFSWLGIEALKLQLVLRITRKEIGIDRLGY